MSPYTLYKTCEDLDWLDRAYLCAMIVYYLVIDWGKANIEFVANLIATIITTTVVVIIYSL